MEQLVIGGGVTIGIVTCRGCGEHHAAMSLARLEATSASPFERLRCASAYGGRVRLLVGLVVFFPEGIQKLIFPDILGAGRFANIGIPFPELMGPFVGVVEIICGAFIILGLFTRLAAIPLIIIMIVAIVSTKVPILLGHDVWIFHSPKLVRYGFWSSLHEARADFDMLLGSTYLLIEGGGAWSLDALLARKT
jgi:putative oxidoreductase